ncbi:MAG: helix-turn-helix domain-containing protein [Chloroflexota bacterium]
MSGQDHDLVMRIGEVAEFLKMGRATVYRWAKAGVIPGRKIGGAWRFSRPALEAWLQQQPNHNHTPDPAAEEAIS